jgi:acyl carrier protein
MSPWGQIVSAYRGRSENNPFPFVPANINHQELLKTLGISACRDGHIAQTPADKTVNLGAGKVLTFMEDPKRNEQAQQMIDYIVHEVIRRPGVQVSRDTPLVSSGLMDSLALVQILLKLEDITHMRIPAGKVQPKDMDNVNLMFATAQRVGRPRK